MAADADRGCLVSAPSPTPRITIRVVRPPTTGEQLDAFYRERNMIHGGEIHSPIGTRGTGSRRIPVRGSNGSGS